MKEIDRTLRSLVNYKGTEPTAPRQWFTDTLGSLVNYKDTEPSRSNKGDFMSNPISVITLPIKTEKWQEDIIEKRFELCRNVYNAMLGYERKKYHKMTNLPEYKSAKEIVTEHYKNGEKDKNGKVKKTPELKAALDTINNLYKEHGFSEFSFTKDCTRFYQIFKQNISSSMANRSISAPMWAAFDDLLFGNGEDVRFKKRGSFGSVVTDGRSGIRIIDEEGRTVFTRSSEKLFVSYGTTKGKVLKLPIIIDEKDSFKTTMLTRNFRTVRILHKKVRGKYLYFVQLAVEGNPAIKIDKNGGKKHLIGDKKVGLYIDTVSITIATDTDCKTIRFNELHNYEKNKEKIADINRYLDTSRRISNPENFNEDGTIKKGIMKDGVRQKLAWTNSKGYYKAKDKKADIQRVDAENRKIDHEILANLIISFGHDITVNKVDFKKLQTRKKGNPVKKDGSPASKAMAGETIGDNAPAMLLSILDRKLLSAGYTGITKETIEVDKTIKDYRAHYAKELMAM